MNKCLRLVHLITSQNEMAPPFSFPCFPFSYLSTRRRLSRTGVHPTKLSKIEGAMGFHHNFGRNG